MVRELGEEGPHAGALQAQQQRIYAVGISDTTSVEVLDGLKEGDVVVCGLKPSTATSATRSLLGSPFGGPPRPR